MEPSLFNPAFLASGEDNHDERDRLILGVIDRRYSTDDDTAALAGLGHKQELQRNFSTLSMLGLTFAILNSWTALSASLSLALPSGGPTSVIWGLVTAGVCNLCLAASLAEFLSAYVQIRFAYLAVGLTDSNLDIRRQEANTTGLLLSAGKVGFLSYLGP